MTAEVHRFGTPPMVLLRGRVIGVVLDWIPAQNLARVVWEDPNAPGSDCFNTYQWLPLVEVFK